MFKRGKRRQVISIEEASNEFIDKDVRKQYQISRAEEYLKNNNSTDGCESSFEYCIISDLLRIIED